MIWAQVKRQVATKNTIFKMADVEKLMHEAIFPGYSMHLHASRITDFNKTTHCDITTFL